MKIALYIENGLEQVVLTPESKLEADILGKIHDGSRQIELKRGDFYECRGGWVRWKQPRTRGMFSYSDENDHDESTMIVLRPASVDSRRMAETACGLGSEGPTSAVAEGQTPITHCSNKANHHG
jgi:hypothetical protein